MSDADTTFDIRNLTGNQGEVNDVIGAAYATINRIVALYGELSFEELFTREWGVLIPRILEKAAGNSLLANGDAVVSLLRILAAHPEMHFSRLLDEGYTEATEPLAEALDQLWRRHGVLFPYPSGIPERDDALKAALGDLLAHAGPWTYRQVYETSRDAFSGEALDALGRAFRLGILFLAVNDYCCYRPSGSTSSACRPWYGAYCSCAAGGTGNCGTTGCSGASTGCSS